MNRTITGLDIAVIVAYLIGTTLLGIWVGRRQKDAKDYFVADRSIPFVFTTGYGARGLQEPWSVRPIVQKPFQVEQLAAGLLAALER